MKRATAATPPRAKTDPVDLVRHHQRTLERAKQLYGRADALLREIVAPFLVTCEKCGAKHLKEGAEIRLSDEKVARLSDNFAAREIQWGHGACRPYELEIKKL